MEEFKIYSITDKYVEYLRQTVPNVYSNKQENRTHTRKYVGTVLIFIRKNSDKIRSNAEIMYKQKLVNDQSAGYVKSALDFVKLEELCRNYMSQKAES